MWTDENLVRVLKDGGVVVMPTDTLYGIVGSALNKNTVERIYEIRKRAPAKPCIILVGDINEVQKFGISITEDQKKVLQDYPKPVSTILACLEDKFEYLHRGAKSLAIRVPDSEELRNLLLKTGPLAAPSANTEGNPPSKNIEEAKAYFNDSVDKYVDAGHIVSKPSQIIRLHPDGSTTILRQ